MLARTSHLRRARSGRVSRPEAGFTLIELLVVITILGIISGVVVFAVGGVRDRGKGSAVKIDERTIRTAQEAYCAKERRYGTAQQLVEAKLLSDLPTYNAVYPSQSGGPCNGWKFSMLPTAAADPLPPGRWDAIAAPNLYSETLVRLADGRVFAQGFNGGTFLPATLVWDPATNIWTDQDRPPYDPNAFPESNQGMLLTDDPTTPSNECSSGLVKNCGKVYLFGRYLFDPTVPVGSGQWQTIPDPGPGCTNCGPVRSAYVQIKGTPAQCGTNCGKIGNFNNGTTPCGTGEPERSPCDVFVFYDPATNAWDTIPRGDMLTTFKNAVVQLPDGRLLGVGVGPTGTPRSYFLDPVSLTFTEEGAVPPQEYAVSGPQPYPVLPTGDLFFEGPNGYYGVYTPQALGPGSWKEAPRCLPGQGSCLVLGSLADGRVLATEGTTFAPGGSVNMQVFNPAAQSWSTVAPLNNAASIFTDAVLLSPQDGPCGIYCDKMLVAGYQSAEVYTP